jgi:LPS-assembly lipoprotein
MQSMLRFLALSGVVLLLVACGFQPKGSTQWPLELAELSVSSPDPTTVFMRELMTELRTSGVASASASANGVPLLMIERQNLYREALTISQDARVQEYVLYLEVGFSLFGANGESIISDQSLRLSRDYRFQDDAILASRREEEFLERNLARSMAVLLLDEVARQSQGYQ